MVDFPSRKSVTARSGIVPETSTTLLRDVADPRHRRWETFYARYEPMMRAYLRERFPSVDADEIVQRTFAELAGILPSYAYDPDGAGHFHNYLTGIVRHQALRRCREERRDAAMLTEVAKMTERLPDDSEEEAYRQSLAEIALARFFADGAVAPRTKEIFRRVAVDGEAPENVAASFQMERHAVDQLKSRSLEKIRKYVAELEAADRA